MIKIIEYGRQRIKCLNCDSVLEYTKSDTEVEQTGINEYGRYIVCPVCKEHIRVQYV